LLVLASLSELPDSLAVVFPAVARKRRMTAVATKRKKRTNIRRRTRSNHERRGGLASALSLASGEQKA